MLQNGRLTTINCNFNVLFSLLQILNTVFKQTKGNQQALYLSQPKNISLQSCRFDTQFTAVTIVTSYEPNFPHMHLRMSQSSFTLHTSDQSIKIIDLQNDLSVSWMLWKTEFQINSYLTMSSDKNFTKQINRIVTDDNPGTIAETQYASGTKAWNGFCLNINMLYLSLECNTNKGITSQFPVGSF